MQAYIYRDFINHFVVLTSNAQSANGMSCPWHGPCPP